MNLFLLKMAIFLTQNHFEWIFWIYSACINSFSPKAWVKSNDQRANGRILENMYSTLVRGDSSKLKCYDSGEWKTLGPQKELACPNGACTGTWITEPGKLRCLKTKAKYLQEAIFSCSFLLICSKNTRPKLHCFDIYCR